MFIGHLMPGAVITFQSLWNDRSLASKYRIPDVQAIVGDGAINVTGGYGGWETVDRYRRVGLTTWKGFAPIELTAPILFDEYHQASGYDDEIHGDGVEEDIGNLEKMAGRGANIAHPFGSQEPGPVHLKTALIDADSHTSNVVPNSVQNVKWWVITNLEWGESIRNSRGNRVRQAATVTLLQYVQDQPEDSVAKRKNSGSTDIYTTHRNDTLAKIAHRFKCSVANIKKWNPHIRDGRQLKPGTKVKIAK